MGHPPEVISGHGYEAEIAEVDGLVSLIALRHLGTELLASPGAPLITPWLGRLSSQRHVVDGEALVIGDEKDRVFSERRPTLDERGRPLHGLSGGEGWWRLESSDAQAVAVATFDPHPAFPFAHRIEATFTLDAVGLHVDTALHATGDVDVPVAFGWHPYLAAPADLAVPVEVYLPFTTACLLTDLLPSGVEQDVEAGWLRDPVMDEHWRVVSGMRAAVRSAVGEISMEFTRGFGWAMTWVPAADAGFVCIEPMAGPLDPFVPRSSAPRARPGVPWMASFVVGHRVPMG